MNRLPDMVVIDFFEWMKHRYATDNYSRNPWIINYVLGGDLSDFSGKLNKDIFLYSIEHRTERDFIALARGLRDTLQNLITEIDFCKWLMQERRSDYDDLAEYIANPENFADLDEYIKWYLEEHPEKYINTYEFRYSSNQILYVLQLKLHAEQIEYEESIPAGDMAPSVRMSHSEEMPVDIELDFLEWLYHTHGLDTFDFEKMPVDTFKIMVDKFIWETNGQKRTKNILIQAFKNTKRSDLLKRITSLPQSSTLSNSRKTRDFIEAIQRYNDKTIEYKCIILQRKVNSLEYQALIENYWEDLHYLSGNYLDIYYDTNYGTSGFEIADKLNSIPVRIKKRAPVIVLWTSSLREAQGIDIRQLSNDEIFEVIRCIVEAIRDKKSFDNIVMEANHMADELRDSQKPIEKIGVQITGGQVSGGVFTGINEGTQTVVYHADSKASESDKELLEGFTTAEKIIHSFKKLDNEQKSLVIEALNEARDAVKAKSDKDIEASKKKFSNTITLLGTVGKELIATLAGVASILKFFGFGSV